MYNKLLKEHRDFRPKCPGDLSFDFTTEHTKGAVLVRESCMQICKYKSPGFNLYKEVDSGKRGMKAASANIGLNVALPQTPIGPSSIRRLCLGSNIPAPSRSYMFTSAGKVCKEIERINSIDMKSQRNVVKTVNKIRGMPENEIIAHADRKYYKSLFSGVGKTPFQPATQCNYVVAENVTPKKQAVTLENVNKLCIKHGFISLRTASAILCLVAVLQQFQWRLPLEMRKNEPKTAFWI